MKITYNNIKFDSELEVDYYKYLQENKDVKYFIYHPISLEIVPGSRYTPDFIVFYKDKIEVIETKGYNQFSYLRDSLIHNTMLKMPKDDLKAYVVNALTYCVAKDNDEFLMFNKFSEIDNVIYRKIKYLKTYGWVDFNFKNTNTLANQRKAKINELEIELKELRTFKKEVIRYFNYIKPNKKLTKRQLEWKSSFEEKLKSLLEGESIE